MSRREGCGRQSLGASSATGWGCVVYAAQTMCQKLVATLMPFVLSHISTHHVHHHSPSLTHITKNRVMLLRCWRP